MSDSGNSRYTFELPGLVCQEVGEGGLPKVVVTTGEMGAWSQAMAEIYLNGATVTRYDPAGRTFLFCSQTSRFAPGKAIRGGVPVIFPWFGPHPTDPSLPQHGFARSADWTVVSAHRRANGDAGVTLALESSEATMAVWPYEFSLRYTVTVGRRLEMALEVINRSSRSFRFDEALHTYLCVSDVRLIRVTGLEETEYVDKVQGGSRHRLGREPLRLTSETDRVFLNTAAECRIHDSVNGDILVGKENSSSTVVWNPWQEKAEAMADLAGDQWHGFVCVETANAMENAIELEPGGRHTMVATVAPVY